MKIHKKNIYSMHFGKHYCYSIFVNHTTKFYKTICFDENVLNALNLNIMCIYLILEDTSNVNHEELRDYMKNNSNLLTLGNQYFLLFPFKIYKIKFSKNLLFNKNWQVYCTHAQIFIATYSF